MEKIKNWRAIMLKREIYLNRIRPFYDDFGMIKVLVGMRRAGKSVILEQIMDELISNGVPSDSIIFMNLDKRPYMHLSSSDQLLQEIEKRTEGKKGSIYLFLDEIQNVKGFEVVIEALRLEGNYSIFITGSNSYLMSGELASKLTGRYISFDVYPFSFSEAYEYGRLRGNTDLEKLLDYFTYGGLPKRFDYEREDVDAYINSVIMEIIDKDLKKKVKDKGLFMRVLNFISLNSGLTFSSTRVVRYLKNEGIKTTNKTVLKYLDLIEKAKLITLLKPYAIKGKVALVPHKKAYVADFGLKRCLAPLSPIDYSSCVETIINNELLVRGYSLVVGKMHEAEIDFMARKGDDCFFIQATYLMIDEVTINREMKPLLSVKSAYPKFIISLNPLPSSQYGVRHLRLVEDFLLNHDYIK